MGLELPGGLVLTGDLAVPSEVNPSGVVAFAHGSRSSRRTAHNRALIYSLDQAGFATLLLDLMTEHEKADPSPHLDSLVLAARLGHVAGWLAEEPQTAGLRLGLLGAGPGRAAALASASQHPELVRAVVCWGVSPDLLELRLEAVRTPVLLIADSDRRALELGCTLRDRLRAESRLMTVPGATHAAQEAGPVQRVARAATGWFIQHL